MGSGSGPLPPAPLYEGPGMDLDEWEERLDTLTRTTPYESRVVRYFIGGDEYFGGLKDEIIRAQKSVRMHQL